MGPASINLVQPHRSCPVSTKVKKKISFENVVATLNIFFSVFQTNNNKEETEQKLSRAEVMEAED